MGYADIQSCLAAGDIVILDGGTGTELDLRGVPMNAGAWCGVASLDHLETLEAVHRDYISAGAQIITANTFASSRHMLREAGYEDRFEEINRNAVRVAHRAREASGRDDVLVAGSLSHMVPVVGGAAHSDLSRIPSAEELTENLSALAQIHKDEGCDLILLEMMFHPDRMPAAFTAAMSTGLPVWAGFSARRGENGDVLGFYVLDETPFEDVIAILDDFNVQAAGIMHTPSNIIGDAISILQQKFDGPLMAYPDSGYFKMPDWQFDNIISPQELKRFAGGWIEQGVQVLGGCCGLSPEHVGALASLRNG